MSLIPWRKWMAGIRGQGRAQDTAAIYGHIADAAVEEILYPPISALPPLTLGGLILTGDEPTIWLNEIDQTDPEGRYRLRINGGMLTGEKATAAAWAAFQTFLTLNHTDRQTIFESPDDGGDDWYTRLGAGGSAGEDARIEVGSSGAAVTGFRVTCGNGSGSDIGRLTITTGAVTSIAGWNACQQSGVAVEDLRCTYGGELTISGGEVTRTGMFHHIDTQSNAASDDLDTINGGSVADYDLLVIRARHTNRTVVVKHGTGNIQLKGGADISLDSTEKALLLFYDTVTGNWLDLGGGSGNLPIAHDLGGSQHNADTKANFNSKISDDTMVGQLDVDDTPANGATTDPISSNWAFDHEASPNPHSMSVVSKTSGYTATTADNVILCNTSGGAFTITLPAASTNSGRLYRIKKIDSSANALTVDGNASETIDGATIATITTQYESVTIVCDGSNWHIT